MVLFDDSGLLVRTNPAFDQMAGRVPVSLAEGDPDLARLLAWGEGGALARLKPGSRPIESQGWITVAGGSLRRLRAIVRCYRTAGGERRYMGIVEDRSVEEERDLARVQIGAMMDTAGVGIATFEESSGWVRHGQAARLVGVLQTSTARCRARRSPYERLSWRQADRGAEVYASSTPTSAALAAKRSSRDARLGKATASVVPSPSPTSLSRAARQCWRAYDGLEATTAGIS